MKIKENLVVTLTDQSTKKIPHTATGAQRKAEIMERMSDKRTGEKTAIATSDQKNTGPAAGKRRVIWFLHELKKKERSTQMQRREEKDA